MQTLVDSSVWLDYFRGVRSPQTDGLALLHDDEEYDPFEEHLGLQAA